MYVCVRCVKRLDIWMKWLFNWSDSMYVRACVQAFVYAESLYTFTHFECHHLLVCLWCQSIHRRCLSLECGHHRECGQDRRLERPRLGVLRGHIHLHLH